MRFVQGRADQIVHRRIGDHKRLRLAALHVNDARDENTGIADEQSARLENQLAAETARRVLHDRGIVLRKRRRIHVVAIGNAEPAAEIDMRDGVTVGAQRLHEFGQERERIRERRDSSVIWLPICISTPRTRTPLSFAACA